MQSWRNLRNPEDPDAIDYTKKWYHLCSRNVAYHMRRKEPGVRTDWFVDVTHLIGMGAKTKLMSSAQPCMPGDNLGLTLTQ